VATAAGPDEPRHVALPGDTDDGTEGATVGTRAQSHEE
jgi:hypothetical protein